MRSVFLDDITKGMSADLNPFDGSYMESYRSLVKANNVFLTVMCVLLGNLAFAGIGYHLQCYVRNTSFLFSSLLEVMLAGAAIGVFLWVIKGTFSYIAYKIVAKRRGDADGALFMFLTVEGMSDIVYLVFVPIYILALLFDCNGLVLGGAVAFKYFSMYGSYPALPSQQITSLDRIVCIIASLGALVIVRGVAFLVFGV